MGEQREEEEEEAKGKEKGRVERRSKGRKELVVGSGGSGQNYRQTTVNYGLFSDPISN